MVIEFYCHPQSPPSCIVWMVLKELGIDYQKHEIDLLKQEHKSEAYAKINPRKKVPAIKDGDLILSDSRAIAMYLCTKYEKADKKEKLYPRGFEEAAKFHNLLFIDIDNYHAITRYMNGEAIVEGRAKGPVEELLPKCEAILAEMDNNVKDQPYMFGSFLTFLDLTCSVTVSCMAMSGYKDWDKYPNLMKWKAKLSKLPYFEECVTKPTDANIQFLEMILEKGPEALAQMIQQAQQE